MIEARSTATELIDEPDCDPALAADGYRFMEMINRRFGGARTVRRFLAAETAGRDAGRPLRILDIGSGSCDIPLAMSAWARERGIPLQFTCLEIAGPAAQIAQERIARSGDPAVKLILEDAFTHDPAEPYDCATASMCFHHFTDPQILTLLRRLGGFVRQSLLINDLLRSRCASLAVQPLLIGAQAGVRHDVLLSIRRGFRINELRSLLQQIGGATVSVKPAWWFRVAAIVRFDTSRKKAE